MPKGPIVMGVQREIASVNAFDVCDELGAKLLKPEQSSFELGTPSQGFRH